MGQNWMPPDCGTAECSPCPRSHYVLCHCHAHGSDDECALLCLAGTQDALDGRLRSDLLLERDGHIPSGCLHNGCRGWSFCTNSPAHTCGICMTWLYRLGCPTHLIQHLCNSLSLCAVRQRAHLIDLLDHDLWIRFLNSQLGANLNFVSVHDPDAVLLPKPCDWESLLGGLLLVKGIRQRCTWQPDDGH